MISQLLDKIVCAGKSDIDKLMEIAPFIIFGAIWIIGLLAKSLKSKAGKQDEQLQTGPKGKQQPDLKDFVQMVKQRYAEAKEQAKKSSQPRRDYTEWSSSRPASASQTPAVTRPAPRPQTPPPIVARPAPIIPPKTGFDPLTVPEPQISQVKELPTAPEPSLPDLSMQVEKIDEHPAEMSALDHHIYEPRHNPYLPELMEQLAKPDGLRKAFLYGEIFGKPVGLREN